jgi:glycolate oxidase
VSEIVKRKVLPFALEYMPLHAVETAERYLERKLPDNSHPAYLLIGVEGNSEDEVESQMLTVAEVCEEMGSLNAYVADTPARQERLWEGRKCLFDAYKAFWEMDEVDACVPRNRIPDYIEGAEAVGKKYGVIVSNLGHAGDGNVHSIIARGDLGEEEWKEKLEIVIAELIEIALKVGGTISGEHGVGYTKKRYLVDQIGVTQIGLMKEIKKAFDPHNILNPGKVFDI